VDELHEVFESVARYFSVLGEPTRLRILHTLCQEERCVSDILKVTGLAQANVSRHLGLMYQAGMLSRRREGNQIFYRVADPVYAELCRSVSVQVAGRVDSSAHGHECFNPFTDDPSPRPSQLAEAQPTNPLNQKEKASV
jgi:DNA-binding transcriptional ArsR family regulator